MTDKLTELKKAIEERFKPDYNDYIKAAEEEDGYFNPCDAFGGNFDDAFYGGQEHGYQEALDEVLDMINTISDEKVI